VVAVGDIDVMRWVFMYIWTSMCVNFSDFINNSPY